VWRVVIGVGYFVDCGSYTLGVYRWRWLADFAARVELMRYPLRTAHIARINH